jgi:hypothetical protein
LLLGHSLARHTVRLLAAAILAIGALAVLPAATGTAHAATPTINCDTVSHRSADWATCQALVGTASCYWDNGNGTFTMALGYRNPTDSILTARAGTTNNGIYTTIVPTYSNPGRLTTFYPGTSVTAFTMTSQFANPLASWSVMGTMYTFTTANTPLCAAKPVPIMGNTTAAAAVFVLLVGVLGIANRRRLARVARSPWLRGAR